MTAVLVLKSFYSDLTNPDETGCYVKITARRGGLLAWLMTLLCIDRTTTLSVRGDSIELAAASLKGSVFHCVPINKIASVTSGYHRSLTSSMGTLLLGFCFSSAPYLALIPAMGVRTNDIPSILFLILPAFLIVVAVCYLLSRTLRIGFSDVGGQSYTLCFKSSVIEGQKVDAARSRQASETILNLIRAANPVPGPRPLDHRLQPAELGSM